MNTERRSGAVGRGAKYPEELGEAVEIEGERGREGGVAMEGGRGDLPGDAARAAATLGGTERCGRRGSGRERPFPSVRWHGLAAVPRAPRRGSRGALAVSGSPCAWWREPSAAPRQLARGGAAPAPKPAPTPPRAGEERKAPDPGRGDSRGGRRPAPHERARGVSTKAPGRARHTKASPCTRRAPLCSPARAPALTSGQRGTVVHRDPDLLNPALSQLQRHLRSLGSEALSPLRRTQTRGTPRNKGEEGVRAQQRGPCALPGAAGGKGALC